MFGLFYDGATHQRHAGIPSCRVLFTPAIKITTTVSTYSVHSRQGTLSLRYVTTHFHDPFEQRPALAGAWKNFALFLRALDTARVREGRTEQTPRTAVDISSSGAPPMIHDGSRVVTAARWVDWLSVRRGCGTMWCERLTAPNHCFDCDLRMDLHDRVSHGEKTTTKTGFVPRGMNA